MEAPTLDALLTLRGVPASPIYPVRTVAELLWISPRTVRRLIRDGKFAALRRERRIIGIPHTNLTAYLGAKNGGSEK
jgi:excisionase family DNA binding protein